MLEREKARSYQFDLHFAGELFLTPLFFFFRQSPPRQMSGSSIPASSNVWLPPRPWWRPFKYHVQSITTSLI